MKPHEYRFITSHVVFDTVGESENRIFESHDRTPKFTRPMEVLSNNYGILRYEPELEPSNAQTDNRYFSIKSHKRHNDDDEDDDEDNDEDSLELDYKKVERRFRKMPTEIPEILRLSCAPCGSDEECTNMLPERRILTNEDVIYMTVDDFDAYKECEYLSPAEVESKPDLKKFLLKERINANEHDIEAWIDYIDIQVHFKRMFIENTCCHMSCTFYSTYGSGMPMLHHINLEPCIF